MTFDDSWRAVSVVPPLGAGEVHVWCEDLSAASPWPPADVLSSEERAQATRMLAPGRRDAFVRGRSALRLLVGMYLDIPAARVAVRLLEKGKPVIDQSGEAPPLSVSVAHSGSVLAVAVTRAGDVGVDVENEARTVDRIAIARRFFTEAESASVESLGESAFFALWAHKEAMLKAAGDGLTVPLSEVEFRIDGRAAPKLRRVPPSYGTDGDWTTRPLATAPSMAGAIAVRGGISSVHCLRWTGALVSS